MKLRDVMTRDVIGSSGKSDCTVVQLMLQKKINGLSSVDASGLVSESDSPSPRPVNAQPMQGFVIVAAASAALGRSLR